MEQSQPLPHRLEMTECSRITMTGAKEVIRFESDQAELVTSRGTVTVLGADLHLKCLSLEDGTVVIQGKIGGILYEEPTHRRRFFR